MNSKLVSIVIPLRNKRKAERCINYAKQQTYENIELILVNQNNDWFPSQNRNFGYIKSHGSLIMFLDEDEYLYKPTTISACVKKFEEGFGMVGTPVITPTPKGYMASCVSLVKGTNVPNGRFFRKDVLVKVGLFDTQYVFCDDLDMVIRVLNAGFKFGVIDQKDGCILHDETNVLKDTLRKTLVSRKPYKKLRKTYGEGYFPTRRKRMLEIIFENPHFIFGIFLTMFIRFIARRIP